MKQIPLTRGQYSLVDDCDYEAILAVGKWCYTKSGYAVHYWRDSTGHRRTLYLHRFIYTRVLGHAIPPTLQIDHRSSREQGEKARLNNQRHNLRVASRSQNQAAKGLQINSRSGHKGCTLRSGKFDVRLRFYNHRLHLGRYKDFEVAAAVYAHAHRLLWQEFTSEGQVGLPLPPDIQETVDERIANLMTKLKA
jgi:hypothetical protein